jgi:hypothetical protein
MVDDKSYLPEQSAVVQAITVGPTVAETAGATPSFRILRTNQLDPYETQKPTTFIESSAAAGKKAGNDFAGTARKAAKTSIAPGPPKSYNDLIDLLKTLPSDQDMIKHDPPIDENDPNSTRVTKENKNVQVAAWLYAASRETDNDFHLILGRDPDQTPRRYMTAEVSGLPPSGTARTILAALRAAFERLVQHTPGLGYDFYEPPFAVTVTGSLFFDKTHATGGKPGPPSTKPATIWEIHPVTKLTPRKS